MMAIGFMRAVYAAGLRVPDDVSVAGFDGIDFADYCEPPLTTVRQPREAMGRAAAELLFRLLGGGEIPPNGAYDPAAGDSTPRSQHRSARGRQSGPTTISASQRFGIMENSHNSPCGEPSLRPPSELELATAGRKQGQADSLLSGSPARADHPLIPAETHPVVQVRLPRDLQLPVARRKHTMLDGIGGQLVHHHRHWLHRFGAQVDRRAAYHDSGATAKSAKLAFDDGAKLCASHCRPAVYAPERARPPRPSTASTVLPVRGPGQADRLCTTDSTFRRAR